MKLRQSNYLLLLISLCCAMEGRTQGTPTQTEVPSTPGEPAAPAGKRIAPGVLRVGEISHPRITESSGLAASRQFPGVFWTHNDGGGGKKQVLYAISREGKPL